MSEDKIRAAVKVECDRQQVDETRQAMLYNTYMVHMKYHQLEMHHARIRELAFQIEPENLGQYRLFPCLLGGVVGGVMPNNIFRSMTQWINEFNYEMTWETPGLRGVDFMIREFLAIHPFSDGNGRTAWLLRVWMLEQWDDPQPLPNYFGE